MSGIIGPNAKVRVDGIGDHDLATIEWTKSKPKTPFVPFGKKEPDRYTSGQVENTWSGTVQSKPNGTFAIDWDGKCDNDEVLQLVFETVGRKERLVDCVIDEVGNTTNKEDGSWQKSISGKFGKHRYE